MPNKGERPMNIFAPQSISLPEYRAGACAGIVIILAALLIFASSPVSAQEIGTRGNFKPTEHDLMFLPPYCRARVLPKNHPEAVRWSSMLRGGWNHVHHYCIALQSQNELNTASAMMNDRERRSRLQLILRNIEYVEKRVDPTFALWNEMMTLKMQAQGQLQIHESIR
jgi:hypothetical protein